MKDISQLDAIGILNSSEIPFRENQGELEDKRVIFYSKTLGASLSTLDDGGLAYSISKSADGGGKRGWTIKESISGAFGQKAIGEDPTFVRMNDFKGKNPLAWRTNIAGYDKVTLGEVLRGITLEMKSYGGSFEKTFRLKPQARVDWINLRVEGAESISINEKGELEIGTNLGAVKFTKPIAYQEDNGKSKDVEVAYYAGINNEYGFKIGGYDSTRDLIIVSSFVSSFSGEPPSYINSKDDQENIYIAGNTAYPYFPSLLGAYDTIDSGYSEAIVFKIDNKEKSLLASTVIGGSGSEWVHALIINTNGDMYVVGGTSSQDFPTTAGAYDESHHGSTDVFISKLNGDLNQILASTLLGGSGIEEAYAITIAGNGDIYVAGSTNSADFPITPDAYDPTYNGGEDAFLAKLDENLKELYSSSFFGGPGDDRITSIGIDQNGNVSFGGLTSSSNFPTPFGSFNAKGSLASFTATFDYLLQSYLSFDPSRSFPSSGAEDAIQGRTTVAGDSPSGQTIIKGSSKKIRPSGAEGIGEKDPKSPDKPVSNDDQVAGPGWFMMSAGPVSQTEAENYYEKKRKGSPPTEKARRLKSSIHADLAGDISSPEIQELARALRYDPKLIYDYVHNNIDYVPYFGSLKGALLTYLDGSGNDFDQASLMIALLRASGFTTQTAQFVYGTMTIPGSNLANWFGVDQIEETIQAVLADGGIITNNVQSDGTANFTRVWVKATIDGVDYLFDPAFKSYTYASKINIGGAMGPSGGYNQNTFMAAVTTGNPTPIVTSDYVKDLNESGLRNQLTYYATNLINTIKNQYPNDDINQIVGGRRVDQTYLTSYQTSLPFSPSVTYTWSDIPNEYTAKIRIQHVGIDYTINTPDLAGKRVTLTYAGGDHHPELRQEGSLLASGNGTTLGSKYTLTTSIDHPYPAFNGTYADQTVTHILESGKTYALSYNFGGISDTLVRKRQKQLDIYRAQGLSDTSEAVLGETLNIMSIVYLKEWVMAGRLSSALSETVHVGHHNIGVMAQEAAYYIDIPGAAASMPSRHNIDGDKHAQAKVFTLIGSGFEHGILEQLMGSDKPGASTVKLLQIANSTGRKIFYANSANYSTGANPIRQQLQNYLTAELDGFQTEVDNGRTLILPESGQLVLNEWRGKGYISKTSSSFGMVIGGGYSGGYNSYNNVTIDPPTVSYVNTANVTNTADNSTVGRTLSPQTAPSVSQLDPVDMASGSYLYDRTDLSLGGNAPMGLSFSRSYNSNLNLSKRTLGYGWTHNYDIYVIPSSHGEPGLGGRQPVDAAGMITALYICLDLLKNQDAIQYWVAASLVSKWAVDQVVDNAVTVNLGNKVMEYIKLPDGTYAAPPGITTGLIKNQDGTFSLQERFGTTINFNADKKISQIVDVDGNTMTFTYSSGNLTTVRDAFNRTLTLQYTGGRISTVTDSAGRSVSYGYDGTNENLTSYTDAETKTWSYGYSDPSSHRLTSLSNPISITTATNTYDTLGRVMSQTVPRQGGGTATYNFYISGFRNVEEDPAGHSITYYYDQKGREYKQVDPLGNTITKEFDGQNHITRITDPRGRSTDYQYDGQHNLTNVTNALSKTTINHYDAQNRLDYTTDPLTHTTHFAYDSHHHLTEILDAVGNRINSSYYPNGLKSTSTDGKRTPVAFAYDAYGNPQTARTGRHPVINYTYDSIGRLGNLADQVGSSTGFSYDNRSLLRTKTDPLGRVTNLIYDNAGRLYTKTDRKNHTITYAYTPTDKLQTITYPGSSTVSFSYNSLDNLYQMQDSLGTTTYGYDAVNRLTSVTDPHGFTVTYNLYDEAGNLKELIYPGNKKVIYTYDELNRRKTVRIDWLNKTATYYYDDAGRLDHLVNFNGSITTYGYDNSNRLTSLENRKSDTTVISTYQFATLDGNGNRKQIIQNEPYATIQGATTTSYSYNTQKNRLTSAGGNNFEYDYEGQLSSGYGTSYSFDYEHRLTWIGASYNFAHDGAGNRLEAVRGGVVTRYIYDASASLLAEADGQNQIMRYYIYGLGLMAMVTPADQVYCYHFNAVGSTIAITDLAQVVQNKYTYDPFGEILNAEEAVSQPFTFVGQYGVMTEPNGLYYMRARYYDPDVGRFISEDPIGFEGGDVNLFAYVLNNPLNFIDPEGTMGPAPFLAIAAVKGGGAAIATGGFLAAKAIANVISGGEVNKNADINRGAIKAFSIPLTQGAAAVAAYGGLAGAAAMTSYAYSHPETTAKLVTNVGDAIQGYVLTGPPPVPLSWGGIAGSFASYATQKGQSQK